jgi:hypothetical protein
MILNSCVPLISYISRTFNCFKSSLTTQKYRSLLATAENLMADGWNMFKPMTFMPSFVIICQTVKITQGNKR